MDSEMKFVTITITGMQCVHYIGSHTTGIGDVFMTNKQLMRFHIYGHSSTKKYVITLYTEYGVCPSGWQAASWGHINVRQLARGERIVYTHIPKHSLQIKLPVCDNLKPFEVYDHIRVPEDIDNKVFEVSRNADDIYYPRGFAKVNMDLFQITPDAKEHRVVWIIHGNSGTWKSYFVHQLRHSSVYETKDTLPDVIIEDVIVCGAGHNVADIKSRVLQPAEIHVCMVD